MGWLKALRNSTGYSNHDSIPTLPRQDIILKPAAPEILHIENVSLDSITLPASLPILPFASPDTPNTELPLLTAAEVSDRSSNPQSADQELSERLYIVIDSIVYDCTEFVHDHPGGQQVIDSFRGQDCSWQFWRFHDKEVLHEWGRPLRIARTEGVKNRWKERPRFVGLRKLGASEEDGW